MRFSPFWTGGVDWHFWAIGFSFGRSWFSVSLGPLFIEHWRAGS